MRWRKYSSAVLPILLVLLFSTSRSDQGVRGYSLLHQSDSTDVAGRISENTTWTLNGSPYVVTADVIVETDVLLTVEPGVFVGFLGGTRLVIDGELIALGNSTHRIVFTGNGTAAWGYIDVRGKATIQYAEVSGSGNGVYFEARSDVTLSNMQIFSNEYGLTIIGGPYTYPSLYIDSTDIVNNSNGIYFLGYMINEDALKEIRLTNCTVSHNGYGIMADGIYGALYLVDSNITFNAISINCPRGATYIQNSRIENNGGTGCMVPRHYLFVMENSLVSNNTGDGVAVEAYQYPPATVVRNSTISRNGGVGLSGWYLDVSFCTIKYNKGIGVVPQVTGGSEIHDCNIFGNFPYDIKADPGGGTTNATLNWWGTNNDTRIREKILDYDDDYNLGTVLYTPYLNASIRPMLTGDINEDGTVDIFDAILLASAFETVPGSPSWNSPSDLNCDGTIDIYDAILLAIHFDQHSS